ncbi:hypothetical protein [Steroidobacter cummioxidans]|uniref:hypothetical protein n=1 Tax=Steroidobacter cummioxidans TaxID=1803913 RepID=UPI000E314BCB|nr:hypothetical protein [Steroidobacter cummioxidans]
MSVAYRIQDEPIGDRRGPPALDPFWLLLAMMFGGAWLGATGFAVNAWLLRGPTWGREIGIAIAVLLGAPVILFGLGLLRTGGLLPGSSLHYALLLIVAWKLGLAYWIYFLQQNSHALYEYFSGAADRGQVATIAAVLIVGGGYLKSRVVHAVDSPFWQIMVN